MINWTNLLLMPTRYCRKNLSLRLSLMVTTAVILLLTVTLLIMFYVSKRDANEDALHRASQTLEGAMVNVDNIMLSIEQTAGNSYYNFHKLLNNPDTLYTFSRKIIETNPCVVGCAIAFMPDFYPGRKPFMACSHRNGHIHDKHQDSNDSVIVCNEAFGPLAYYNQNWFTQTIEKDAPQWLNPMQANLEPLFMFCLPIHDNNDKPVGVLSIGVSISLLSGVVASTKPSPQSYCALMNSDGTFIVSPTGEHLLQSNARDLIDKRLHNLLDTVLSGEKGHKPFQMNGQDFQVFYQPFKLAEVPYRADYGLNWTIAVIMTEKDIFGEFYTFFLNIVFISLGGTLLLLLCCWGILNLRIRPLRMLTENTKRIAQGHYDEPIPDTKNTDEIGTLQRDFIRMRRAIASQTGELERLTETIQQRSMELKKAYKQAKKADKMKTAFLHHMSNQMLEPAVAIDKDVMELCASAENTKKNEKTDDKQLVDNIQENGNAIAQLLSQLLNLSEDEMRKEVEQDEN